MPKFKINVERAYFVEHIVDADDKDHALEIASEVSDNMKTNWETFAESNWNAKAVSDDEEVTYTPEAEYFK